MLNEGTPDGALVVLAHGLEDSWRNWRPLTRRLDPAWRLVALDLPWRAGNDYRWRHEALPPRWLRQHLDRLDRAPDLVIAHSYGATAALDLAARDKLVTGGLVLICPLFRPVTEPVDWTVVERSRISFDRHLRAAVRVSIGPRADRLEPELLDAMIDVVAARIGPAGFLAALDQFVASSYLDLPAIAAPALFLIGGADPTLVRRTPQVLAERMPGARVLVDESYDHFCHVRRADPVAGEIGRFVTDFAVLPSARTGAARGRP